MADVSDNYRVYNNLANAIRENNKETVKDILLAYPTIVNETNHIDPVTPLAMATDYNRINIVKILIEHGADLNLATVRRSPPLYIASMKHNYKIARLLIEHGANVNITSSSGNTPLHIVEDLNLANLLVSSGANINAKNNNGLTPLYTVASILTNVGSNLEIIKMLINHGADVNEVLTRAARDGNVNAILKFIKVGVKHMGDTWRILFSVIPLSDAMNIIRVMKEMGVDIYTFRDDMGSTILHDIAKSYALTDEEKYELFGSTHIMVPQSFNHPMGSMRIANVNVFGRTPQNYARIVNRRTNATRTMRGGNRRNRKTRRRRHA